MIHALGCIVDPFSPNFRPSFQHPCQTHDQIQIMLDPCHMLKLIRNCLGDLAVLHDNTNTPIQWAHLTAIHNLHQNEGLRLGNKLKSAHIDWQKQKI